MNRIHKIIALILISAFLIPFAVYAHPGRTNKAGCHTCKTNCTEKWGLDYGEYHCHNGDSKKIKKAKTKAKSEAKTTSKQ